MCFTLFLIVFQLCAIMVPFKLLLAVFPQTVFALLERVSLVDASYHHLDVALFNGAALALGQPQLPVLHLTAHGVGFRPSAVLQKDLFEPDVTIVFFMVNAPGLQDLR